jgi:hypothetical protein
MAGEELFVLKDVEVVRETSKALLIRSADLEEETWIPKGQVHDNSDVYNASDASEGDLTVTKWIAEQKGWT